MEPLELERRLKRALEAQDPPEDFTDRVLKRCMEQERKPRPAREERAPWTQWLFPPRWRMALAGSLAMIVLATGIGYRQHQERLRGEKARAELMLALHITGKEISRVHHVLVEQPGGAQE